MQGVGVAVTQPGAVAQSGVWHDDLFSLAASPTPGSAYVGLDILISQLQKRTHNPHPP